MATVSPQALDSSGAALTWNNASAGGDRVPPGSYVIVRNTSGGAITPTLVTPATYDGNAVADKTANNVAATTGVNGIKIPNNEIYKDPSDGMVGITWSATTNVQFAVIS